MNHLGRTSCPAALLAFNLRLWNVLPHAHTETLLWQSLATTPFAELQFLISAAALRILSTDFFLLRIPDFYCCASNSFNRLLPAPDS